MWSRTLLLDLAARVEARQPPTRKGPEAFPESRTDLGVLWAPDVLPDVRASDLCGSSTTLPTGREDAPDQPGTGEGRFRGHLARAGRPEG